MDSRDNLWHDAYLILMHPIVKFIKRVGLILFKPATFAEQHLHLRDQTNFLRQARFFNEAAAYTLVASTLPAYLTKFAFLNSEYRYWLFITTQAFLCVGVIYLLARCFVGKSILLKDVVHVFLPVAAASMIAGTIFRVFYWGGSELLDLSAGPGYAGVQRVSAFTREFFRCAIERSAFLSAIFSGEPSLITDKPVWQVFLESGMPVAMLGIASAAIISEKKFVISRVWAGLITLVGLTTAILLIFGTVIGAALSCGDACVNVAYFRMGKENPLVLLQYLADGQKKLLPIKLGYGVEQREVTYDDRGLVASYFDSRHYDDAGFRAFAYNSQKSAVNVFCDLAANPDLYYHVLRELGLGVTSKHFTAGRENPIISFAGSDDCHLNYRPSSYATARDPND